MLNYHGVYYVLNLFQTCAMFRSNRFLRHGRKLVRLTLIILLIAH
jgi:hypothetical protein